MTLHLAALLDRHAQSRSDHTAVVFGNQRLSFRELHSLVGRVGHSLLSLGLRAGDKVALLLPNCLEQLGVYWASARLGIVTVPLSPLLRGSGLAALVRDCDARAVISTGELRPVLDAVRADLSHIPADNWLMVGDSDSPGYRSLSRLMQGMSAGPLPLPSLTGEEPFNIIYSSGTTGQPKGIVLPHRVRATYGLLFAAAFRIAPESVVLHAGSLVFNGVFVTLMPACLMGCTYVLEPRFDPDGFLETIEREGVTHAMMVPSQIVALMQSSRWQATDLSSLRMICSVGAPFHREHKDRFAQRLPGVFHELYGLTEGFVTILDRDDFARRPDSVGIAPPLFEMRIVDDQGRDVPPGQVGEIAGRGPILMSGYYKRPDLTSQAIRDGWLLSGDLGYRDDAGFLYLVDRKKDLIISGGVNVFPKDIEEVAVRHPGVREVAVFGVPDSKWGEAPVAAVILREAGVVSAEVLRDWINDRVEARYQQVREVLLLEDFPRSSAGKTLKRVMREQFWAGQGSKI